MSWCAQAVELSDVADRVSARGAVQIQCQRHGLGAVLHGCRVQPCGARVAAQQAVALVDATDLEKADVQRPAAQARFSAGADEAGLVAGQRAARDVDGAIEKLPCRRHHGQVMQRQRNALAAGQQRQHAVGDAATAKKDGRIVFNPAQGALGHLGLCRALCGGVGARQLGRRLEQGRVVARFAEGAHHIALLLQVVQVVADGDGGDAEEHAQRLDPHLVGLARQLHDLQPALE